ncbi:MAG: ABC transporter permease [Ruminococcus sp.]|nr:ABC transporter permease [Ruminococcus sp.]
MKAGFYPKLAFDGIRKNKQMYLPYIMTCVVMVMMYYIMSFLQYSESLSNTKGVATIREILGLGTWVIAIFSCIFLFYTNSFLIRKRKKEFGLYNILGMGKRNISVILFWEALIIFLISVALGLLIGIALSKMAELALILVMHGEVTYTVSVSISSVIMSVALFGAIFVLLFLNALRQIKFSSSISLLRSENVGEKPPKANWFFGILGILILAGGYAISLSIKNPLAALFGFFVAVILVIIGTYITMISGSVLFCKILQKNKRYYYKLNHFVSVSSMAYRMKRNGAGLASICFLATMVLVIISSTASLYIGGEDAIRNRYPREITVTFGYVNFSEGSDADMKNIPSEVSEIAEEFNSVPSNVIDYRDASFAGQIQGNFIETDYTNVDDYDIYTYSNVATFNFIPLEDYNSNMGTNYELNNGEALLYSNNYDYNEDSISFRNGNKLMIKSHLDKFFTAQDDIEYILPVIYLIVPDVSFAVQGIDDMVIYSRYYQFDTGLEAEQQTDLRDKIDSVLTSYESHEAHNFSYARIEGREANRDSFYSLYGGLFYLGIVLSLVFLIAAVLIIYYKQISEGYEDQSRFEIMQKVGMTKREIRKSINSQLLTVFFLPLILAGVHLAFAFPLISKMLMMFGLFNSMLYIITAIVCLIIFAFFYAVVYKITSNAYYRIVSVGVK